VYSSEKCFKELLTPRRYYFKGKPKGEASAILNSITVVLE
jgi:hypothetical protein